MARKFLELTFTPAVLQAQTQYYGRPRSVIEAREHDPLGAKEETFIAARDSFYMATVTESGWPYLQHRGGPQASCACSIRQHWHSPITRGTANSSVREA